MNLKYTPRRACRQSFLLALAIAAGIFLPFVILDHGLFFYYGDFNVQQIPFYQLVHRAIRSGDIFWNWYTDLGVNFIGSYSFYNLFSPFFWLTLPFPTEWTPYFMAPLLVLKTACAAAAASLFLSRFTEDRRYAVLGSLLYAFSGWATYNVFFNHFHEAYVVFPLVLYALELLVVDGRRGLFALTVAANAAINYWFFIGVAVFVMLYVLVRTVSRGWDMTVRKFVSLSLEAVFGVMIAGAALLPSVLAILGNPRTTSDNLLWGWDFWVYGHGQRPPAILASLFFPPDIPSRPNMFPDHGAKWASLSAWLPMVGPSLVIAYLLSSPKSWLKRMLYTCLVIAMVPGLNSLFILLNHSYYARWFYMPLLLMALASTLALERWERDRSAPVWRGVRITACVCGAVILAVGLTPDDADGEWTIGLSTYPERFWIYAAIVAISLCAFVWALRCGQDRRGGSPLRRYGIALGGMCIIYSVTMITMGRLHSNERDWMRETALNQSPSLPVTEGEFARADLYDSMDNLGMFWGLPNIQAFHSIVPVSLMEFYPSVGVKRDVSSKPQPEFYELRSLLSVKWLFVDEDEEDFNQPSTAYFSYYDTQLGFNIYQNDNYLPMGLCYDRYVTRTQWNGTPESERVRLLHRGVLIEDEDVRGIIQIIDRVDSEDAADLDEIRYLQDVRRLRENAADSFSRDNRGFTSTLSPDTDCVVFYSVPYDKGWSATVNGVPTRVLKVNGGFCGVPVNAGNAVVRFTYLAPGLIPGALLTLAGLLLYAALLLIGRRLPPLAQQPARSYDLCDTFRPHFRFNPHAALAEEADMPADFPEKTGDAPDSEAEIPEEPEGEDDVRTD